MLKQQLSSFRNSQVALELAAEALAAASGANCTMSKSQSPKSHKESGLAVLTRYRYAV